MTRSGCSNAAAVGSTRTSFAAAPARSERSNSTQPGHHSPPPISASVPTALDRAVIGPEPTDGAPRTGTCRGAVAGPARAEWGRERCNHARSTARPLRGARGRARDASTDQIGAAFRSAAKTLHPDRVPDDPEAAEQFKALSRAYATLARPRSRAAYDARHPVAPNPSARETPAGTPTVAPTPAATHAPIFSTPGRARAAVVGGFACLAVGLAIIPVLLSLPPGHDTVGRDVTLWLVVAKLLICGGALVGTGWWRLRIRPVATRPTVPTGQ